MMELPRHLDDEEKKEKEKEKEKDVLGIVRCVCVIQSTCPF
jgi:hypothetical protein